MSDFQALSLVDQVTQSLLKRIEQNEWAVGARMPGQNVLAAELGVSVVVVREALARLKADGLVESRQGAGVFVVSTSEAAKGFRVKHLADGDHRRLAAVLEVRSTIEVAAAELAATRRHADDVDECTDAFKALRAALAKGEEAIAEDFNFHLAIANASHNEFYPELLRYLHQVLMRSIRASRERTRTMPRRLEQVQDEHAATAVEVLQRQSLEVQAVRCPVCRALRWPIRKMLCRTDQVRSVDLVQCATLFCTYREAAVRAALARVTLAKMSLALAVQMKGLGCAL
jgi:Transcriptional regulators